MTMVKICGLSRFCDIDYVNAARPDYCGFIINFPKSRRNVTEGQVRELRARLHPDIQPVGVFVDQPIELVAQLLEDGTIAVAQLHGHEDERYIAAVRALAPGKPVWKAYKIRAKGDLERAGASSADLILLDNGYGTGETFDWSLVGDVGRPFLLAGGLTPENLSEAMEALHPYGVDISSGVETDGVKDERKILTVVNAVREE